MTRKRCHRRAIVPLPPRGLRPKLAADQVRDLAICHHQTFDAIARGPEQLDPALLWDYVGSTLTWWKAAQLLGLGVDEMAVQLEVATRLCERWQRTRCIRFDGRDLELARRGLLVMDELARTVDRPTAVAAADWSEREVEKIAARARIARDALGLRA